MRRSRYVRPIQRDTAPRRRLAAKAALNRPRLPFDGGAHVKGTELDPATFPPSRTVLESKARGAPFVISRTYLRDGEPRTEFYAGTGTLDRAVLIASGCPDRAVVVRGDVQGAIVFDNNKTPK